MILMKRLLSMNSLIEVKVYLVNKYLNKYYRLDDTHMKAVGAEKIEYFSINNILFRSIEKAIFLYRPLLIMGMEEKKEKLLRQYIEILNNWNKNEKRYNDKETDTFIKDYNIDLEEVDNIILKMVSDSFINLSANCITKNIMEEIA